MAKTITLTEEQFLRLRNLAKGNDMVFIKHLPDSSYFHSKHGSWKQTWIKYRGEDKWPTNNNTKDDIIKRNGIVHIFKPTGTHVVDFVCDIIKLESLKKAVNEEVKKINFENKKNYCILLTNNNPELKTDQKIKNTEYICKWKNCKKIKTQSNKTNFKYLLVEIK